MASEKEPKPRLFTREGSQSDLSSILSKYSLTLDLINQLWHHSNSARKNAYCPYSNFHVGCALYVKHPTPSGSRFITGANVENAAYPVGSCAERVAMGAAVASGLREGDFEAIGVVADAKEPCSPCGMCRQFIREFCPTGIPVVMFNPDAQFIVRDVGELLPESFGPQALDR